jgi:mono/diheme cytochrome c family protein
MHLPGRVLNAATPGIWVLFGPNALADNAANTTTAPKFFESHCTSCHGEKKQKGDTTLQDTEFNF